MKTSVSSIALAVIGIGSLAFAIPMSVARAQKSGESPKVVTPAPSVGQQQYQDIQQRPGGPPAQGQPGFGGPPGQAGMMQNRGMGGGGGATMVADGDSLYILQGNHLFKVGKSDLKVVKEGILPMPGPMGGGRPGEPGGGGGQTKN